MKSARRRGGKQRTSKRFVLDCGPRLVTDPSPPFTVTAPVDHSPLTFHPNLTLTRRVESDGGEEHAGDAPKAGQLQGDRTSLFLSNWCLEVPDAAGTVK